MDTDSQTVLSTGLDSLRFRINIFKFRQFHLPFFIRRKIWTYMRYVIDMYEYLIALCSWHQASMVNLASVKDGAFNDNGIPGLGGGHVICIDRNPFRIQQRGEQTIVAFTHQNLSSRYGVWKPSSYKTTRDHRYHRGASSNTNQIK